MTLRHSLLRAGLALFLALGTLSAGAVTVNVQGDVLKPGPHTLGDKRRLLDAINQAQPGANVYWLGAHYARRAQLTPQTQLKAEVLIRLSEHQAASQKAPADGNTHCLDRLAQTLDGLPVTGRQPQTLDPHTLDLDPRANRRLRDGDSLWLPARSDHVLIQGMVERELKLPYRHGQLAASYLAQATLCAGADLSHAWIIYPDGATRRIGIAYWNEEPINLAPGARLMVPLAERRWNESVQTLNARMAEFLATQPLP